MNANNCTNKSIAERLQPRMKQLSPFDFFTCIFYLLVCEIAIFFYLETYNYTISQKEIDFSFPLLFSIQYFLFRYFQSTCISYREEKVSYLSTCIFKYKYLYSYREDKISSSCNFWNLTDKTSKKKLILKQYKVLS